jgi:hypothetical protein
MEEALGKYNETDFLEFDSVENKRSGRADLHAFLLLDSLVPGARDMVSAAEHDEIFLEVDVSKLAELITMDQVRELSRCGVRFSDGCLAMFV